MKPDKLMQAVIDVMVNHTISIWNVDIVFSNMCSVHKFDSTHLKSCVYIDDKRCNCPSGYFQRSFTMKISSTHRGTGSDWYEGWKGVRYHDAPKTKTRVSTFISFGQLNTGIKHIVKLLVEPSTLKEMIMVRFVLNIMFSRWCSG